MINTTTRKVQLTGTSTLTVSLPKSWAKKNNINRGSELVLLEEPNGNLAISVHATRPPRPHIINVSDIKNIEELSRFLFANYLAGFRKIIVQGKTKISDSFRSVVHQKIRKLMGLEVVEEDETHILIQDFFTSEYMSMERLLNRAFTISQMMFKNTFSGELPYEKIHDFEREVDRIHLLISRQLNLALSNSAKMQELKLTSTKCLAYRMIIESIEIITDHTLRIAMHMGKLKKTREVLKNTSAINSVSEMYAAVRKSMFSGNFKLANEIIDKEERITKQLSDFTNLMTDIPSSQSKLLQEVIYHMYSIITRIVKIAEANIDMSVTL